MGICDISLFSSSDSDLQIDRIYSAIGHRGCLVRYQGGRVDWYFVLQVVDRIAVRFCELSIARAGSSSFALGFRVLVPMA